MMEIVRRRWLIGAVVAGLLAAIGVAAALASSSAPAAASPDLGTLLGPHMARAEVIVVLGGTVHDIRVDQGRLRAVGAGSLDILERDGTLQTVPVSPGARVTLNGAPSSFAALHRGLHVIAIRDGDAPAGIVRARGLAGR
jgi:hypothetical protein